MRIRVSVWGQIVAGMLLPLIAFGADWLPARAMPPQAAATTVEVKIDNFSFSPQEITVSAGTTIIWTNRDDIPHTVVSDEKVFKSKVLDTDQQFSYTFAKPGTYPYFCSVHPKMTGRVVVK
jgi:plastocyanin